MKGRIAAYADLRRLFERNWYIKQNPDVVVAGANPLRHYLKYGWKEERDPHPLFSSAWYTTQYGSAIGSANPLWHYCVSGWRENKDPHPYFSTRWYLEENPDVAASGMNPLVHYSKYGWKEGRRGHPDHDTFRYLSGQESEGFGQRPRRALSVLMPFRQSPFYRRLRREFDADAYVANNADVAAFRRAPRAIALLHWLLIGFREGRPAPGVKPFSGRVNNPAIISAKNKELEYVAFMNETTGLGSAARSYVSALQRANVPVSSVVVRPDLTIAHRDNESANPRARIFHLNADHFLRFFLGEGRGYLDNTYNIGLWVWELPSFRPEWAQCYGAADEIWTPSNFCRQAIGAISPIPVVTIPHAVSIDRSQAIHDRGYFGLRRDCFIFSAIFDVGSQLERKNPIAVIEAFKAAFGKRTDVALALKYYDSSAAQNSKRIAQIQLAGNQENILHFPRIFDDQELVSFKSVSDCFVSAHRAEGFGLNIAEAMLLGKPAIATNYSGNTDFMDAGNSYPVDYVLKELTQTHGPYFRGNLWAEPSFDHLVATMKHVFENQDEARAKGEKASAYIAKHHSLEAVGAAMRERLEKIGFFSGAFPRNLPGKDRTANYTWRHELATADAGSKSAVEKLKHKPRISVLVPVYDVDPKYLRACIESVRRQAYPYWELVLYDDKSTRDDTLAALREYQGTDPRIKVGHGEKNRGISGATNAALEMTTGEFVAFLDNDDEIAENALLEYARAINERPEADLLYCDEDKLDERGRHCDTYFKPDWSPEHLESCMYVLHMMVVRRSLLLEIGGLRTEFDGSQDYDLALRLGRKAREVVHITKILYHWRKIPGSAAAVVDAKPWALTAAKRALEDYVRTGGMDGTVEPGKLPGLYRVRRRLPKDAIPTLVIITGSRSKSVPGRGKINLFDNFLRSIREKTVYPNGYRILAVDAGELSGEQRAAVEAMGGRVISYDRPGEPFNFAARANFALKNVDTEYVVLLNDDMEVISPEWLEALIEVAQLPTTGAVGAKLYYPDNRIQHFGMVLGIHDSVAHVFHQYPGDRIGYSAFTHVSRNVLSVTGACLATRMSVIEKVGGFDERLAHDYNDVDLCFRMHAAGFRNSVTPFAELYHFENSSIERRSQNPEERRLFFSRWKEKFPLGDPYYNPNLPRHRTDYGV